MYNLVGAATHRALLVCCACKGHARDIPQAEWVSPCAVRGHVNCDWRCLQSSSCAPCTCKWHGRCQNENPDRPWCAIWWELRLIELSWCAVHARGMQGTSHKLSGCRHVLSVGM